jgi:hypothetical protein
MKERRLGCRGKGARARNLGVVVRSLVVAGTVAVLLVPPAVTLGAPSGPVYVPPHATASARSGGRAAGQSHFRVPFDVDVRPRPLAETQQELHGRPVQQPTYLWYQPAWYQPSCSLGGFDAPSRAALAPNEEAPADFTIGSLIDRQSQSLFSPTQHSYTAGLASNGDAIAATNPVGLSFSTQSTPCGPSNFVNL